MQNWMSKDFQSERERERERRVNAASKSYLIRKLLPYLTFLPIMLPRMLVYTYVGQLKSVDSKINPEMLLTNCFRHISSY